jgi:hypothetical protein
MMILQKVGRMLESGPRLSNAPSRMNGARAFAGQAAPFGGVFTYNPAMKFGRIKRQHGRVGGLDDLLNRIVKECPHVSRIVPGRIKVRRGKTPPSFKVQYPTQAGLKCLFTGTGTVQEVFLICNDADAARQWLIENVV